MSGIAGQIIQLNLYGIYKISANRQTGFYNQANNQTTLLKFYKKLLNQRRLYATFPLYRCWKITGTASDNNGKGARL